MLKILFNDMSGLKNTYELDIFIPDIKLAFEINGIYHYEPIYGDKQFLVRQTIDKEKITMCLESNITLYVLDTREQKVFTPETSQKYLSYICEKIDQKIKVENPTAVVK